MITVRVNETEMAIDPNINMLQLLQQINSTTQGIAVAINHQIISKHQWESQGFSPHDEVLIIKATQGG